MSAFGRKSCAERKGTAVPRRAFVLLPHLANGPTLGEDTLCSDMVNYIHVIPRSLDDTMEIFSLDPSNWGLTKIECTILSIPSS